MKTLIDKLAKNHILSQDEFIALLSNHSEADRSYLISLSRQLTDLWYGRDIFTRGLIEFTNYCKNDCFYCGIRKSNKNIYRYHLDCETILDCCRYGYKSGFTTFVLQGGEDLSYSKETMCNMISRIHEEFPECAITLSIGEKSYDEYKAYFDAGATRYLLRHETANAQHYQKLHPESMSFEQRRQCLKDLKSIGFQTGAGFMVGSPFQTYENLAQDLQFIYELQPEMIGIGPFIPQHDTPFKNHLPGTLEMTVFLIAILRLIRPNALIPATTALGTIHPDGRKLGIMAGANVVMPNLSPPTVRADYSLYDNKLYHDAEAAESRQRLIEEMASIGYIVTNDRGDIRKTPKNDWRCDYES